MRKENYWKFIKENLTSIITIASGAILIILNRLSLIPDTGLLVAILAILTMLATTELIDRSRKLDQIENDIKSQTERITKALGGVEVFTFSSASSAFEFIAQKILESEGSIDHAALAPSVPRWSGEHRKYEEAITKVLKGNEIRYRYLARIPEKHRFDRIKKQLSDPNIKQFYVKYFASDAAISFHNFMVFDGKVVVVNFPYEPGEPEKFLAISHPEIVNFYRYL